MSGNNVATYTQLHAKLVRAEEKVQQLEAELAELQEYATSVATELMQREAQLVTLAAELAKLREQAPVAWMHDKDGRVDTCHDSVKELWIKVGQKQNTQFMREIVPCRVEHYNIPLYAAPAPAVPALSVPDGDDFNGTTPHLIQCMEALVRMDADGVLVPHGIGRHASRLLSAAANRLRKQTAPSVPEEWREKLLLEFPLFDDEGLCQEKHYCEWTLQQDRKRLHALLQSAEGRSSQTHNEVRHD